MCSLVCGFLILTRAVYKYILLLGGGVCMCVRYAQDNLGVKKNSATSKNPSKMPHSCVLPAKKKSPALSESAGH
jgi:hypothetical protein